MAYEEAVDLSRYQDPATIDEILRTARTIAIVGLSSKPNRPSYGVAAYLQRQGYLIIPVNPVEQEVLGERAYPSLLDVPEPIDVVDVFRRPEATPDIAREAVAVGAKVFWLQLDIINPEAIAIAEQGGLTVIVDRCTAIEHQRWKRSHG